MIVDASHTSHNRQALQQVAHRIPADSIERQQTARLHVAIRILLQYPNLPAELQEMAASRIRRLIHDLVGVGNAVLRVVIFIAERRISRQADVR